MPKLSQSKIAKINLPSSTKEDPAWAKVNMSLTAGDVLDIRENATGLAELSAAVVARAIQEWNFVDDNEQPAPINEQTVRGIPAKDFNHLSDLLLASVQAKPVGDEEKKA